MDATLAYLVTYLVRSLDNIEAHPEMWAHTLEALVVAYLEPLNTLRIIRGWKPDEAEDIDHTFRRWLRVSATGSQGCIPIWAREGHQDMKHADVVVYLKKLREELLG